MTPLRSCVARPSIGTRDTVAQGSLHCKEHRELQMPRPQCTQVAPPEAGAQRSVAPSTSVDSPCSSSCSNSAEDSCKSGCSGRVELKNRTEKRRNRHVWMNCRVIRDREARGSNPGPPTIFVFEIDDFQCGLESASHRRITISCRATKPGRCNGVFSGQCEIRRLGIDGLQASQAGGRTGQES